LTDPNVKKKIRECHRRIICVLFVNPVRKSSTFQRGDSHGALNPVFALKVIISSPRKRPEVLRGSSPLQAAGLSNGVKIIIGHLQGTFVIKWCNCHVIGSFSRNLSLQWLSKKWKFRNKLLNQFYN